METYKFETTVKENGVIQIPKIAPLARQRVEVTVVISSTAEQETEKTYKLDSFLNKWRGVLKDADPDKFKS